MDWHGVLTTNGIYNFIHTCGHEAGHRQMFNQGISGTSPDTELGVGDGVNDDWERRNNFDPTVTDTAEAYGNLPAGHPDKGKEDRECIADILGLGALQPNQEKWRVDWATSGLQWGSWGTRNPAYSSYFSISTITPYHPWSYAWQTGGQVDPDPPWGQIITSLSQLDGGGI